MWSILRVSGQEQSFGVCVLGFFFLFSTTQTLWITNAFLLSSFLAFSFLSGLHSLHFSPSPPSLHALSLTPTLCLRFLHLLPWCRGGSERVGGWRLGLVVGWRGRCLGIERRGAWPLVCLGAPNESVIHGTRGSHRDGIRGALSNCSPERVKRYLICPPRRQLPLGFVCVSLRVCVCVSVNVAVEGCWLGAGLPPPHTPQS